MASVSCVDRGTLVRFNRQINVKASTVLVFMNIFNLR